MSEIMPYPESDRVANLTNDGRIVQAAAAACRTSVRRAALETPRALHRQHVAARAALALEASGLFSR
jgi:hypothetical protein